MEFGPGVALRKESVDRNNFCRLHYNVRVMVALRKESVDRNIWGGRGTGKTYGSLSARRAWIEIGMDYAFISDGIGRSPQGERG